MHEIGYTQNCDGPLRGVWTLDLDFEASLAKTVGYFSSFLSTMVSDHTPMNYYRAYSKNRVHNLLSTIFVIECSNVLAVDGAKISLY